MPESQTAVPPHVQVIQMAIGCWVSRLVSTAASIPGGEERTANEYDTLLAAAGLKMTRVIPTASDVSIVEAKLP